MEGGTMGNRGINDTDDVPTNEPDTVVNPNDAPEDE